MPAPLRLRGAALSLITLLGGVSLAVIPAATISISSRLFSVEEQGFLAVAVLVATFAGQLTFAVVVESRLSSAATERRVVFPLWLAAISVVTAVVIAVVPPNAVVLAVGLPILIAALEVGRGVSVAERLDRREIVASIAVGLGALVGVLAGFAGQHWALDPPRGGHRDRDVHPLPAGLPSGEPARARGDGLGHRRHRDHRRDLPAAQRDDPRVSGFGRRSALRVDRDRVRTPRDPAELHAAAAAQGALATRHRRLGGIRARRRRGPPRARVHRRVRVHLRVCVDASRRPWCRCSSLAGGARRRSRRRSRSRPCGARVPCVSSPGSARSRPWSPSPSPAWGSPSNSLSAVFLGLLIAELASAVLYELARRRQVRSIREATAVEAGGDA